MTEKNTFYNMLKSNAQNRPDAVAIVYDTMKVTYAKFFEDVTKKALHFQKYDGKRIARKVILLCLQQLLTSAISRLCCL